MEGYGGQGRVVRDWRGEWRGSGSFHPDVVRGEGYTIFPGILGGVLPSEDVAPWDDFFSKLCRKVFGPKFSS